MRLDPADLADLRPLIAETVRAVLGEIAADDAKLGRDRLAFREPEAAALLGVRGHVLGDARRRGEIHARRLGKQYIYSRDELLKFLRDSN